MFELRVGVVPHHPPKTIFEHTSPTQPYILGLIEKNTIQIMGEFFHVVKKVVHNCINIFVFSHLYDYICAIFYKIKKICENKKLGEAKKNMGEVIFSSSGYAR
jgi:hypothetical protein